MLNDIRIQSLRALIQPALLIDEVPLTDEMTKTVIESRKEVEAIVNGQDDRLLVVVGPCSIHDTGAALAYASLLKEAKQRLQDDLCIVMRVYFEKPRTTVGWKGLINDPKLDGSFDINSGLRIARKLLCDLAAIGMPAGTEFLDTIIPQFVSDVVSWGAIGARTTESQIHRELASGLSMPIGFKNGTDGNVQIALDAIMSAQQPHHFLSVTKQGIPAIVNTKGNESCHIILRGSTQGPNYDAASLSSVCDGLDKNNLKQKIMVDCSHGNSRKDHNKQSLVVDSLVESLQAGDGAVMGAMLESHLIAGKQSLTPGKALAYGQSITDACIGWDETEILLSKLADGVKARRDATQRKAA